MTVAHQEWLLLVGLQITSTFACAGSENDLTFRDNVSEQLFYGISRQVRLCNKWFWKCVPRASMDSFIRVEPLIVAQMRSGQLILIPIVAHLVPHVAIVGHCLLARRVGKRRAWSPLVPRMQVRHEPNDL